MTSKRKIMEAVLGRQTDAHFSEPSIYDLALTRTGAVAVSN